MRKGGKFFSSALGRLDKYFGSQPRNAILVISLVLALLVGALDFQGSTGLLIVYLAPISLAAWYGGGRVGAVIAIYCGVAWYLAISYASGFHSVDPWSLWAFGVRVAIFLVLTQVISRLRKALRQQHELTQFIVHDLRSPISSAISGLLTLEQTGEHLDETEREMVSLALISNQRALSLVNSLLDVAKLETGKMGIHRSWVDPEEMVTNCFEQVALWAKGQNVKLEAESQVKAAWLDPELTSRVLVNLLSNALKFSPAESTVTVHATAGPHGGFRFSVEDKGPGIPPEYAESIFEPFAQVKGTKSGTGLGLTFCRLAVHAQGGRIWVESALGKGTSMIFTLPSPADASAADEGPLAPDDDYDDADVRPSVRV